jgi:hypothetical protein
MEKMHYGLHDKCSGCIHIHSRRAECKAYEQPTLQWRRGKCPLGQWGQVKYKRSKKEHAIRGGSKKRGNRI